MASSCKTLEINYGEDKIIEFEVENLPKNQEIIDILNDQQSEISTWLHVALVYFKERKYDDFEAILKACLVRWDQNRVKSINNGHQQRIKVLDLLAIYYVRKGYFEKNREKRREIFAQATKRFTEVDKTDLISFNKHGIEYEFHLLGRAYFCLIEGRSDQADAQFNFVLQQQQQHYQQEQLKINNQPIQSWLVPSLLGRACIEFNKKESNSKKTALSFYKKALQVNPNCSADVRLGIGLCYYKLNFLEKAKRAFLRALAIDAKCVGAMIGLSVIFLNEKTIPSIKSAIKYLAEAYKIDPNNPMTLILLADHHFYRNEHAKAVKLATKALENTENEGMQAQACYQLARVYHKQSQYDNAFDYYYKATQFGGVQFCLAYYGLGQMYIHRKEYDAAIQAFENVLKNNPDSVETMKVLSSLYARSDQTKKDIAKSYLKIVTEKKPDDVEAWLEFAALVEQHETKTAINAYKTALDLLKSQGVRPTPEIYNNTAALLFSMNSLSEAEEYYQKALEICETEMSSNEIHYGSIIFTIQYNLGRLYEAKRQLQEAEKLYKNILKQHPMYLDCYMRLGCMERDRGQLFNALYKFKEVFRIEEKNQDAWILIGNLHLRKQEWGPAQKKFEIVLPDEKEDSKHPTIPDPYALIAVGNVWLQNQYQASRDTEKLKVQRSRALNFYKSALKYDAKNIYAANGIGCILAVQGRFNEARDVFSQVREATADFPDVWINIAHVYVEQKQYAAAVQMYENCMNKFYNNSNTEILSYIARALFKANKLVECKRVLLRARHLLPYDLTILFNLAKVLKSLARQVFADNRSTYQDVVAAEYELKLAKGYFLYYQTKMNRDKNTIDPSIVNKEERDCADLILQVETTVRMDAEQRDKEENQKKSEQFEKLALEKAKQLEMEKQLEEETRLKKEEQEIKRKELLMKLEEERAKTSRGDISEDDEERPKKKKKSMKSSKKSKQ